MIKEFRLPALGENVKEATISKISVKIGDIVKKGQTVIEIETDKAVAEIPISFDGKVIEINVKEGQKVKTGDLILKVEETVSQLTIPPSETLPKRDETKPPLSTLQQSIQSPISPEKTTETKLPPPSTISDVPQYTSSSIPNTIPPTTPREPNTPILASPSVRRLARELGISLQDVPTTNPSGRITVEDILAYKKRISDNKEPISTLTKEHEQEYIEESQVELSRVEKDSYGPIYTELMSTIRKKTAEQMTISWKAPQVTHFDKANITQLEELRQQLSEKYKPQGIRISILSFLIKISTEALKKFPKFNATIDLEKEIITYKKYYNIGIAVDTAHGLLVPVIRDVDKKSIVQISKEIQELAERARNRKLTIEEFQGGTFTISNLGGLGGIGFTPIVNHPQVAILGVSKSNTEPVYKNGNFVPQLMLPLSLSYDHRLIDGAETARFLRWICNALENPWSIFIE